MYKITRLAFALLASAAVFAGLPTSSFAQDDKKITIDMNQADIREALRALFKGANLSYSVAPEVQGLVTVSLHEVPFETALQNILKQADATYRIVGGVYEVIKREPFPQDPGVDLTPVDTKSQTTMRRIYIRRGDPQTIALLISKSGTDFTLAPENSTVQKIGNGGNGGFGNSNFGGGTNNGFGPGSSFNGNNGFRGNGNNGQNGNRGNGGPGGRG